MRRRLAKDRPLPSHCAANTGADFSSCIGSNTDRHRPASTSARPVSSRRSKVHITRDHGIIARRCFRAVTSQRRSAKVAVGNEMLRGRARGLAVDAASAFALRRGHIKISPINAHIVALLLQDRLLHRAHPPGFDPWKYRFLEIDRLVRCVDGDRSELASKYTETSMLLAIGGLRFPSQISHRPRKQIQIIRQIGSHESQRQANVRLRRTYKWSRVGRTCKTRLRQCRHILPVPRP